MKAAIYTTDEGGGVIAHDPILHEAIRQHYGDTNLDGIDYCFTWADGPLEAAWMLEDRRAIAVGDMVQQGVPIPPGYEEYVGQYDPDKLAPRWLTLWWRVTFPLRRLPYALRDAAERRMMRRLARD